MGFDQHAQKLYKFLWFLDIMIEIPMHLHGFWWGTYCRSTVSHTFLLNSCTFLDVPTEISLFDSEQIPGPRFELKSSGFIWFAKAALHSIDLEPALHLCEVRLRCVHHAVGAREIQRWRAFEYRYERHFVRLYSRQLQAPDPTTAQQWCRATRPRTWAKQWCLASLSISLSFSFFNLTLSDYHFISLSLSLTLFLPSPSFSLSSLRTDPLSLGQRAHNIF